MTALVGPPIDSVAGARGCTLAGFAGSIAARFGDTEAICFDDPLNGDATTRWSYNDLYHHSVAVARALVVEGTRPGDRVAVLMGNRPEALAGVFGAALIGAVPAMVSTFAPLAELAGLLRAAAPVVVLTQSHLLDHRHARDVGGLRPELPTLRRVVAVGDDWDAWLADAGGGPTEPGDLTARAEGVGPGDDGLVTFSSGTTATPKGILHSQRGPALASTIQGAIFARGPGTRMWAPLPIFWSAGLISAFGATLATGGTCVLQETFDPGEALALLEREGVTEPYSLPHQTRALAEHPDWETTDLSALRCVYGKSAYARHPKVAGDTDWNMPVGYGLSETCAFFSAHGATTRREELRASHGRLLPGNELRVIDPGTGATLGPGVGGELAVKGPSLMKHHLGHRPQECFDRDGFYHTGDLGCFDRDGNVHFEGRRTEMIRTGGANVSPAEIEVQLRAYAPVKVARIVGVPDQRHDEAVVACVSLTDGASVGEADIKGFLRDRLSSYKVPTRVLFFEDGEIPMTNAGSKVRDPELVALASRRLAEETERSGPTDEPTGAP